MRSERLVPPSAVRATLADGVIVTRTRFTDGGSAEDTVEQADPTRQRFDMGNEAGDTSSCKPDRRLEPYDASARAPITGTEFFKSMGLGRLPRARTCRRRLSSRQSSTDDLRTSGMVGQTRIRMCKRRGVPMRIPALLTCTPAGRRKLLRANVLRPRLAVIRGAGAALAVEGSDPPPRGLGAA